MLEIVLNELEKATQDFYNITGITIALYTEEKKVLFSKPLCDFCREVQESSLFDKCKLCDNKAFDECGKRKGAYIYKCHMGLTEAFSPIIENGVVIGYMSIGHILESGSEERVKERLGEVCRQCGLDEDKMQGYLSKLLVADEKFIASAVSLMSMCACYLYYNKIIKNKEKLLAYQIDEYVKTHLKERLSVTELCKVFYISKSKLYYISDSAFGMGISEYIRTLRIEKAKMLLCESEKNIAQVAVESGFYDANYFTRTFKKIVGATPKEYRKQI